MNSDVKDILIKKAYEIGFSDIKFARIDKWNDEFHHFQEWLSANRNADMHYLIKNKDLRNDPLKILPSAKTMIVTATNYYTPYHHSGKEGYGKISRYSWGYDYHKVIKKMLKKTVNAIKDTTPDSENRYFVDSGPVLEKQWAVRAGIGYQGKNGLIIHPEFGTWIFLGVILTSIEIEPDKPFTKDLCKDCTKCIEACPTNAIIAPKIIDANKCIAYHTIETKPDDQIPDVIKENLNSWIFGCDICQDVCPWNRKAQNTKIKEFYPDINSIELNLEKIINMNEEEFYHIFSKSPVKRTGLIGLQRNALAIKK